MSKFLNHIVEKVDTTIKHRFEEAITAESAISVNIAKSLDSLIHFRQDSSETSQVAAKFEERHSPTETSPENGQSAQTTRVAIDTSRLDEMDALLQKRLSDIDQRLSGLQQLEKGLERLELSISEKLAPVQPPKPPPVDYTGLFKEAGRSNSNNKPVTEAPSFKTHTKADAKSPPPFIFGKLPAHEFPKHPVHLNQTSRFAYANEKPHNTSNRTSRFSPVVKESSQTNLTRTTPPTAPHPLIRLRVVADHVREKWVKVNPTNRYLKSRFILVRLPPPSAYMSRGVWNSACVRAVSTTGKEQQVEKSAYDGDEDTEESTREISEEDHSEQENEQTVQDEVQEGVNSQHLSKLPATDRRLFDLNNMEDLKAMEEELIDKWRKWEDETGSLTINDKSIQAVRGRLKAVDGVKGALNDLRQTLGQLADGADQPSSSRREGNLGVKAESSEKE
ncbi:hypothetical protein PG999_010256 [Apiospora kogelbergensis]|uniref:Uncharacterized protein n=1 Tax=Apiospora kogelbergensis TaxID=1337665 RepID=A0AAW0QHB7_9PEZI